MADDSVSVKVNADDTGLQSGLARASRGTQDFGDVVVNVGGRVVSSSSLIVEAMERQSRAAERASSVAGRAARVMAGEILTAADKQAAAADKVGALQDKAAAAADKGAARVVAAEKRKVMAAQDAADSVITATERAMAAQEREAQLTEAAAKRMSSATMIAAEQVSRSMIKMSGSIIGAIQESAQEYGNFDLRMREVNVMAGLNEEGFAAIKKQVLALSDAMATTQSADKMAESLYEIYSAGLKDKDAFATMTAAARAADAGLTDVNTSAKALTSVMVSYKLRSDQAAYAQDVLLKGVKLGRMHFADLANAIGPVAIKAAGYKITLEELVAMMATMTQAGLPAAEAANAVEKAIGQLVAPTKKTIDLFDELHIKYGSQELAAKGLFAKLMEIQLATAGNESAQRRLLSSSEALTVALHICADGGKDFLENAEAMSHAAGSMDRAWAQVSRSFPVQMNILKKDVANLKTEWGANLQVMGVDTVKFADGFVKSIKTVPPEMQEVVFKGALVTSTITGIGAACVLIGPMLKALQLSLGLTATAMSGVAKVASVVLVPEVVAAVAAVSLAVAGMRKAWVTDLGYIQELTKEVCWNMKESFGLVSTAIHDTMHWMADFSDYYSTNSMRETKLEIERVRNQGARTKEIEDSPFGMSGLRAQSERDDSAARAKADAQGRSQVDSQFFARQIGFAEPPADGSKFNGQIENFKKFGTEEHDPFESMDSKLKDALSAAMQGVQKFTDKEQERADAKAARSEAREAKKVATEEELRERAIAAAQSLVGVKEGANGCARAMLDIFKAGGLKLPDGADASVASFFKSSKFHKSDGKAGDFGFYDTAAQPGVPVHMVMADGKGGYYGNSQAAGNKITHGNDITQMGGERFMGYGTAPGLTRSGEGNWGDPLEAWHKEEAKATEAYDALVSNTDAYSKKVYEINKKFEFAAFSPKARTKEGAADLQDHKSAELEKASQEHFAEVSDSFKSAFDWEKKFVRAQQDETTDAIRLKQTEWDFDRNMGRATLSDRLNQIRADLNATNLSTETKRSLLLEQRSLEQQSIKEERTAADEQARTVLDNAQVSDKSTRQQLEAAKRAIQEEMVDFRGSFAEKESLINRLRMIKKIGYDQDTQLFRQAADFMATEFAKSTTAMIVQHKKFGEVMKQVWNDIETEAIKVIEAMIKKALELALVKLLAGIFSGGASNAVPWNALGGTDLGGGSGTGMPVIPGVTAHSGGIITNGGGLQSFHSGGMVGFPNLKSDEVFAKLQKGEAVISRAMMNQMGQQSSSGGGDSHHYNTQNHYHITQSPGQSVQSLAREIHRNAQRDRMGAPR